MTFNWPDIPFSGTEVDAFVVEYKALAQAIIDDYDNYDVNLNTVKLPFKHREDVKIFLEYGLTYAAFIVKQRAGNSGPGEDFELGNSPLGLILPPMLKKRLWEDTGPNSNDNARKECFENNQNGKNPDGSTKDPDSGKDDNPLEWYMDEVGDNIKDLTTDDCTPFLDKWNDTRNKNEDETCLEQLFAEAARLFGDFFRDARFTYLSALTFKLVERYLKGTGGTYTLSNLHSDINPVAGVWMREDIIKALNKQLPNVVPLTAAERAAYGMGPNGNAYVLNGNTAPGFKNSLGSFTVFTDGTEETFQSPPGAEKPLHFMVYDALTSVDQIEQVRDDYGFNDYGLTNTRSYTQGDMPGDPLPDNQIKSGTEWVGPNTIPCEAAAYTELRREDGDTDPKWNYTDIAAYFRYIIASNHGIGKVDPGGYENAPCIGKPFPIHFDWR